MAGLNQLLRDEIARQGLTQYRIAKDTGLGQTTLQKFLAGTGLQLSTASILFDYLGLKVTATKKVAKKKARKKARQ